MSLFIIVLVMAIIFTKMAWQSVAEMEIGADDGLNISRNHHFNTGYESVVMVLLCGAGALLMVLVMLLWLLLGLKKEKEYAISPLEIDGDGDGDGDGDDTVSRTSARSEIVDDAKTQI